MTHNASRAEGSYWGTLFGATLGDVRADLVDVEVLARRSGRSVLSDLACWRDGEEWALVCGYADGSPWPNVELRRLRRLKLDHPHIPWTVLALTVEQRAVLARLRAIATRRIFHTSGAVRRFRHEGAAK